MSVSSVATTKSGESSFPRMRTTTLCEHRNDRCNSDRGRLLGSSSVNDNLDVEVNND